MITSDLLTSAEMEALNRGLTTIAARQPRNAKITAYYDGVARIRDLGISIPPHLRNIETVVGWPAKTVDVREARTDLEAFYGADGGKDPLGVESLWADNGMGLEQSIAHTSAFMHGVVFATATAGDTGAGEPEVLYSIHEATNATLGWNQRTRRADWGVAIIDRKASGDPRVVILYLPYEVITLRYDQRLGWLVERAANPTGRVLMTMLVRRPRVGRRFGTPAITRAVLSFTDSAVRTLLRSEVSAEFFSVPQRYALGVDNEAFNGNEWNALMGSFLAVSRDERDQLPNVGQFPQVSMQGHTDQLRALATMFSGETSIPVSYLGVIQDNPSSADAIRVSETSLVEDVTRDIKTFGHGWVDLNVLGVMVRDGLTETPAEARGIRARFRDPATPTRSAATQNVVQLIAAGVLPPSSEATYRMIGLDDIDVDALLASQRQTQVSSLLQRVLPAAGRAAAEDPEVAAVSAARGSVVA